MQVTAAQTPSDKGETVYKCCAPFGAILTDANAQQRCDDRPVRVINATLLICEQKTVAVLNVPIATSARPHGRQSPLALISNILWFLHLGPTASRQRDSNL